MMKETGDIQSDFDEQQIKCTLGSYKKKKTKFRNTLAFILKFTGLYFKNTPAFVKKFTGLFINPLAFFF